MTAKLVYRQCPGLGGLAGWVCPFPARVTILDRAEQLQYYPQPLVNSVEITNEGFRVKEFCSACQAEKNRIERKIANEPALHSHECQASTCHHAPPCLFYLHGHWLCGDMGLCLRV